MLGSCFLTACVVVAPVAVSPPVMVPVNPVQMQGEYVPPQEYVIGAPLYYEALPGVAFYPMFIGTPGSCFCVIPMRFYRDTWFGVDGTVIHRGHFPYVPASRIEARHMDAWRHSEGLAHGMRPIHGSFQMFEGHNRPIPPQGSLHHQAMTEKRVNHDPAAARYPVQNHQPLASERPPAAQAGREHGLQGQNLPAAIAPNPQKASAIAAQPAQQSKQTKQEQARQERQAKQDQERQAKQAKQDQETQAKQAKFEQLRQEKQIKPQVDPKQAKSPGKQKNGDSACSEQDQKDKKCQQAKPQQAKP